MTARTQRLVIFDCDGVLVDSEPLAMRILLQTIAEAGEKLDEAEAYEAFLGKSLASVCELLRKDRGIDIDAVALERMRERLYAAIRQELQPIPGILEALEGLDRPRCVASSSQLERVALSLEVTGLASQFGGKIFSASMVAHGKPAPDLFLHAAREMGFAPGDCVVIEDSPAGILAAQAAAMTVLAFTGGSHAGSPAHRRKLRALGPRGQFAEMRQLPAVLRSLEERAEVS